MRAAVPEYLGNRFDRCPPGHRFSLYFPVWENDWTLTKNQKSEALRQTLKLNGHGTMLNALRERQAHLVASVPENERLSIYAVSTAPFATGMGMEHPLENGFAFLNPYGLPYLPASGIKGVLRRAAEELALFENGETTLLDVWWLFGFEGAAGAIWKSEGPWSDAFENHTDKILDRPDLEEFLDRLKVAGDKTDLTERLQSLRDRRRDLQSRGLLSVWDALPSPNNGNLAMEVMTPHYGDYYQNSGTPHDSGQPVPIVFLVVPAGSRFSFHLRCDTERLPEGLRDTWQNLVGTVFEHAFDWLGFGAKTAVGYGSMKRDLEAEQNRQAEEDARKQATEQKRQREESKRKEQERLATLSPIERRIEELIAKHADQPTITVLVNALKAGEWQGDEEREAAGIIRRRMETESVWREQSNKKKPEKDKPYQQTLVVISKLTGES
jgi:CRISPR-associated protein Cmr6